MTPHEAACAAAMGTVEVLPDTDQGPVLQWVAPAAVLTVCLDNIEQALAMVHTLPTYLAEAITVVADSYHATVDWDPADVRASEAAEAMERGDLAERYASGDPTISDAMVVVTVHRTEPAQMTVLPYRRSGNPTRIDWAEPIYSGGNMGVRIPVELLEGRVVDNLSAALATHPQAIPDSDVQLAAYTELAKLMAREGLGADVTPRP